MPSPHDTLNSRRRFYAAVDVAPVDGAFAVRLDGRTPRSPEGRPLVLPNASLAGLVAEEWSAQGEYLQSASMPATRLAWTAIDRTAGLRAEMAAEVARFAATDLICYFADHPADLVRRQHDLWEPVIAWAEQTLEVSYSRAHGITHQPQPPATLERIAALAAQADDLTLTGLAYGAALFTSAILTFALQRGRITADEAFQLSRLDESFQEERWGLDAESAARADALAIDAATLGRWFEALR